MSMELIRRPVRVMMTWGCAAVLAGLTSASLAKADTTEQILLLNHAGSTTGPFARATQTGEVEIEVVDGRTRLEFVLRGLTANAVHSVWLEFDTTRTPFSGTGGNFVATDPETGTMADVYAYTPAAPDNAAFTGGVGLDPNGFIADEDGNATFRLELNYDIFEPLSAPIVLRPGAGQTVRVASGGGNCAGSASGNLASRIDSAFMRAFDTLAPATLPMKSPAFPLMTAPTRARLVRGTVREIRIVEHFDGITHGHLKGVGTGQGGMCMGHDFRLQGFLAAAVPKS